MGIHCDHARLGGCALAKRSKCGERVARRSNPTPNPTRRRLRGARAMLSRGGRTSRPGSRAQRRTAAAAAATAAAMPGLALASDTDVTVHAYKNGACLQRPGNR
eukprot:364247-Chlamydomonas_euryale.AAC.12